MELSAAQVRHYEEEGYLFLPDLFAPAEVARLRAELPAIFAQRREENVREKTGDAVRSAFAVQTYNPVFAGLAHHPRLIDPAMQLTGGPVYIHQFKVNAKAAFDGDIWQWHQDYGTWARDDLMPEPRALNLAVFLDDVTEFNGALMFIPRSHKKGVIEAGHDTITTSYPLWTIDDDTIRKLVAAGGLVAPKGPAGSGLLFHCNLVHGSPGNLSPFDRTIVYISACHVENHIRRFKRAEWIAHRDFTPIEPLPDDCLLREAPPARP
ncbi:MAG: proline hydroxylase [Rhodospirillaceae bacterium]|jgi:ectoine hydroxylase|nr:proline hydroxylase [Rhodospirillaceae bacterium]MBT6117498.1 proline hydroxylase [Rhodospirillaceae bacterium]